MLDRLEQAVAQATRRNKAVGVLLIDLDNFKQVNDEFGHRAGDTILKRVSNRLLSCIRVSDTACRYGGDEFIILLPEMSSADDLDRVKRKLRQQLRRPYRLGKRSLSIGASIGGALFGENAELQGAHRYRRCSHVSRETRVESAPPIASVNPKMEFGDSDA